jgi:hypothetical protein
MYRVCDEKLSDIQIVRMYCMEPYNIPKKPGEKWLYFTYRALLHLLHISRKTQLFVDLLYFYNFLVNKQYLELVLKYSNVTFLRNDAVPRVLQ